MYSGPEFNVLLAHKDASADHYMSCFITYVFHVVLSFSLFKSWSCAQWVCNEKILRWQTRGCHPTFTTQVQLFHVEVHVSLFYCFHCLVYHRLSVPFFPSFIRLFIHCLLSCFFLRFFYFFLFYFVSLSFLFSSLLASSRLFSSFLALKFSYSSLLFLIFLVFVLLSQWWLFSSSSFQVFFTVFDKFYRLSIIAYHYYYSSKQLRPLSKFSLPDMSTI